jgi:hypothetical protein
MSTKADSANTKTDQGYFSFLSGIHIRDDVRAEILHKIWHEPKMDIDEEELRKILGRRFGYYKVQEGIKQLKDQKIISRENGRCFILEMRLQKVA